MIEQKSFSGIMDSDSPYAKVAPNHHVLAYNINFRGEAGNMRAENVLGNRLVNNPSLPLADICPVVSGLMVRVVGNKITYYFTASNATVTNYTINLRNATTNAIVSTQTIAVAYGIFNSVATGSYKIEVVTHCSNLIDSGSVNSGTVTIAAPTCAAVTSVTATVNGNNIDYVFPASADTTNNYSVQLMSGASIIANQTITGNSGTFAGVADGTYFVRVTPNCSNGVSGNSTDSAPVTKTTASGTTYTLVTRIDTSGSGNSLSVFCQLAGTDTAAPFSTTVTVNYTYTVGGGSPINATGATGYLSAGSTSAYIFGTTGAVITSATITGASPSTDGTNTYIY